MRCKLCKRKVRNSFNDRLTHIARYHPEKIVLSLPMVANVSRVFGEMLGDRLKGLLTK